MPTPAKPKAPVVAVLNMKGGVGKTTVSSHVFREVYELQKISTLLIDLDPQFNLTQTLYTRVQYDKLKTAGKTILTAMEPPPATTLFDVRTSVSPPPSPRQLAVRHRWFINDPKIDLMVLPGDFNLVKYSYINDSAKLDSVSARFAKFVAMARDEFELVCIDCNPSSSFLTICALRNCTHVLVPVKPDKYSILGIELLAELISRIPVIVPKPKMVILLNNVRRNAAESPEENEVRSHAVFGKITLASRLCYSSLLTAQSTYTGFATDKPVAYRGKLKAEIRTLSSELCKALGFKK